ncbi:hypothetical protein GAYE_SCF31G4900 [Galdieria yellowstonensis]|uniref:Uncharacterized protein n=1 Tax=Galdieria yellowstonensis TaxID=3028027 RepID=A0AAV9II23_9RHOD|nr:hypothetical protein GAYE_SCF31G4900 [Galdieria yellowstonensis]
MTNPVAWKALYRRYVSLIYRSQLFPPQVRAHAIYFTRHAFRYGVPIDSSTTNSCPVRYSTEEALTRGQRTLDLVLQLAVDRKERMNHDDTCSKDSGLEEENSPNPLGLESVYRDVEDSSTSILEQLEGDELIRALFKRLKESHPEEKTLVPSFILFFFFSEESFYFYGQVYIYIE